MSNLKDQQYKIATAKEVDIEKEFESIRDLMDAYNKGQVDMLFRMEEEKIEKLLTLVSRTLSKLDSLEEEITTIQNDIRSLALEIDTLDSTIKSATSGR